jgi:trk system potassium uptake protein TrkH
MLLIVSLFSTFMLLNKDTHPLAERVDSSSFSDTFRQATFQIVSAQSSTGFATANYDLWPFPIQTLMVIIMFIGGMAGSTSGGIKVVRMQMIFRLVINKIETIFRPDTVRTCRLGTRIIDDQLAIRVFSFAMIVIGLTILGTFLLVWDGIDPETAFTTMACMLNNAGMGFRIAGPLNSFAFLSDPGKLLSSLWMIAGRLEYFTLLVLFLPAFWKKN